MPPASVIVAAVAVAFLVFGVVRDLPVDSLHWLRSG